MLKFEGISIFPGISIGKAVIYKKENKLNSSIEDFNSEITILHNNLNKCKRQLNTIDTRFLDEEEKEIIFVQNLILEESEFINKIEEQIRDNSINSLDAITNVVNYYCEYWDSLDDPFFKSRSIGLKSLKNRLINLISNPDIDMNENFILITQNLNSEDLDFIDRQYLKGLATDFGNRNSEIANVIKNMKIPAVFGLDNITNNVKNNDTVLLDASSGEVIINPNENVLKQYNL